MKYAHPRGHVFYRKMAHPRPKVVRGSGVFLYDAQGKEYLDASGGPLVVNIGHGRQEVVEKMAEQAAKVAYAHAIMFTSDVAEDYCQRIAPHLPFAHPRLFFLSSGSEVVEAAIKLARQLQQARGEQKRTHIISRQQSYHGMTLGALSASGRPGLRAPYVDMMGKGTHVSPPYPYRDARDGLEMAALLEARIEALGSENVAAFLAEPISGASLGAAVPDDDYWPEVRAICDRHGVLLIADEVLTGFGRTGRFWALSKWGVRPDILVSSKGTAGGYMPVGFVAADHDDIDLLRSTLGDFNHGGTFSHHPVALAAAAATLDIIERESLVERARKKGKVLRRALDERLSQHPHVGDIRGEGLLFGIEIVDDKTIKRPFPKAKKVAWEVHCAAFADGLIVYPSQGCADGEAGDVVLLGPPFVLDDAHIVRIADGLHRAIDNVTAHIRAGRGGTT